MEITWYGLSCFRIREGGTTIVCDPYHKSVGAQLPKLKADIVTVSHDQPAHNDAVRVGGEPKILTGPGEYEIQNVFITGLHSHHRKQNGSVCERNIAFFFEFDGFCIGHLGDMGEIPKKSDIDERQIGEIDILMVPVGGGDTLDSTRAAEMVGMLEPKLLLPMHYQQPNLSAKWIEDLEPVDKFVKELGVTMPETQKTLKITKSALPEETQVVLLDAAL